MRPKQVKQGYVSVSNEKKIENNHHKNRVTDMKMEIYCRFCCNYNS